MCLALCLDFDAEVRKINMKVDVDRRKEKSTASENTVFMNEIVNEECLNEM